MCSTLEDIQEKMKSVDEQELIAKLESSEARMNEVANATLLKVQKAVGLRWAKNLIQKLKLHFQQCVGLRSG